MAREAGLASICEGCDVPDVSYAYESWDEELKAFEALVRADEREACAKMCEKQSLLQLDERVMRGIDACTDAIRAMENT
jgi:hypothetical protein